MKRTPLEVAQILENFLEGGGKRWDWDDFTSLSIDDPALDAIRIKCDMLSYEFPPELSGHYCGPGGVEVMRALIAQLRQGATWPPRPSHSIQGVSATPSSTFRFLPQPDLRLSVSLRASV